MKRIIFLVIRYTLQTTVIITAWYFCLEIPIKNIWAIFILYPALDFLLGLSHKVLIENEARKFKDWCDKIKIIIYSPDYSKIYNDYEFNVNDWKDYYKMGYKPEDAISEDISYAEKD